MIQNPFAGGFCILSHSPIACTRGYSIADEDPDLEQLIITSLISESETIKVAPCSLIFQADPPIARSWALMQF